MDQLLSLLESAGALLFVGIGLGFCVFSHELGHFLAGRWRKMHIDAFSIGFKKIWSKKVNGVEYRIGCIPLGGYVELPQVDATDDIPKAADGTELERAKPVDRIITAVAGPLFNIICGLILGCLVWWVGVPQDSPTMSEVKVAAVQESSPEYNAGLRAGDVIVKINGDKFSTTWANIVQKIMFSVGEVTLDIERNGESMQFVYTPIDNPNAPGRLKHEKIGYPFFVPMLPIELQPLAGSVAEKAGIKYGDMLLAVDGKEISSLDELQLKMNLAVDKELLFKVKRGAETLELKVTPELVPNIPREAVLPMIGIMQQFKDDKITVIDAYESAPAFIAGVRKGDQLLTVNDNAVTATNNIAKTILEDPTKSLDIKVLRDGKELTFAITPVQFMPRSIGVELMLKAHPTPIDQLVATVNSSYKSLRGMLVNGANFLGLTQETSTLKPRHMSGPLYMGTMLYSSVKDVSLMTGLYFIVMISFALAIFNLLPLPVLDGGHILFAFIEMIIRRPLPTIVIKSLTVMFISGLIGLMLYITYFDVMRTYRTVVGEEIISESTTQEP